MAGARNVPECSLCSPVGFARQERIVCMIKLFLITMMRKNLLCIREKKSSQTISVFECAKLTIKHLI
jgi:hypothetical protein